MSFAIAAAGTGGHVYPGLAVGEALVDLGVSRDEILYIGGQRLEAQVYPEAGFPFLSVELRGLSRQLTLRNLGIPRVVMAAVRTIRAELVARQVKALLGLGGYVTVPAGLAARSVGVPVAVAEQNAEAGLANRVVSRFATRVFGSFPITHRLPKAEWVGNPLRRPLAEFDRERLRPHALVRFGLEPDVPVLGVFGGSLGAGVINRAVIDMLAAWDGPSLQVLHLAGQGYEEVSAAASVSPHRWVVLDFIGEMDAFFAACDLVVARAGGSVAELTATATPAILVPGGFGSGRHQALNAAALAEAGAAVVVTEDRIHELAPKVEALMSDSDARRRMADAARKIAKPQAATVIAQALIEMAST
ncbi:MAG TPA: UDP-N-acetylglucosamine--N-acetylmuramyl-(pentapeptide) pyrophosphoryl-undecaprenol N-acetylglucosamine transferase [Acidimicrobiia bacterium]